MITRLQSLTLMGLATLATVIFVACGPAANLQTLPPETVLLDVFSINNAWGFDCGGCCVDAGGNVHHYDCSELRDSLLSPEWRGREPELLKRRFRMSDTIVCHVDLAELESMQALIREVSGTQPTEQKHSANDAGSVSFTAYIYGPKPGDSSEVLLTTGGDFSREPSSDPAERLVKWLRRTCSCQDSTGAK